MPVLGYTVIDQQGQIRVQEVDRRFGENVEDILEAVRTAKSTA
jgi:hypothetical protein